jgi:hypothetical protein
MGRTPIVIERRGRGVYRLRHGRFLLAAVLPNLASAVARSLSLAHLLDVELHYREKPRAVPVVLAGR